MAKGAYIGVLNEYYPAFADNTWAQIIKACQKNEVPSSWAVGDSKMMTINGTDYPIDIIGKKHDTYADGSGTAPLTFQMHDSYASSYAMNSSNTNSGGWESTAIRTTRLPAILALMPSEVQAGIKEVNKITGQGGSSFALETTADKLFILSVNEIFGYEPSAVAKGEGSQYAYYANGNSTQKKQNGEYNYWWTRSPVANNSSGFFQVRTDGSRVSTNYPSGTYGVAFAFCFGGTSELNTEFPSLGSVARKVKKGYIGVPTLSDSLGDLEVGATIKLNVGGTATDFLVVQQGKPSSLYDDSCDGTWLLMKDCYEQRAWNSADSNSYKASTIHNYLNSNFLSLFDANIQSVIKQVKIPYYNGVGGEGKVASGSNGLSTKVFLLSMYEVGFTTSFSGAVSIDGAKLSYFTSGSTVANYNGSASDWYLRSPYSSGSGGAWYCQTTNGNATAYGCTTSRGIRPAIILPANLALVNGTVDGTEAGWKDVARKIKKAYIGVNGVAKLCWVNVNPVFANNTWAEIIATCQANSVPDEWKVGDSKTMTIGGTDYLIDIIGKDHDTYSDGSGTAPLTLQLHDLTASAYTMNSSRTNSGGWDSCVMRKTHLPAILATMPTEVQVGIKEVNKVTSIGSNSTTKKTSADKLFLLSEQEIFGNISYASVEEGTRYAYYTANSEAKGSNECWWTRSPNGTQFFVGVAEGGGRLNYVANRDYRISFAFCF